MIDIEKKRVSGSARVFIPSPGPVPRALMHWWPVLSALFVLGASPAATLLFVLWRKSQHRPKVRSVAVVVLGDIGRSPRMMYHAESFAQAHFDTWIIGYRGMCVA